MLSNLMLCFCVIPKKLTMMKHQLTLFSLLAFISFSCKKESLCDSCQTGTLYYTPDCSTINGYVVLDKNNETVVFQHQLDELYRKSGIKVCIIFDRDQDNTVLTAECTQGQVIRISCIEEK